MKIKVIKVFRDKYNHDHIFAIGEVADLEESRALSIVERGLGEKVEEEVKEETPELTLAPADTKVKKSRKKTS